MIDSSVRPRIARSFTTWLTIITVAGLAVRIAYVIIRRDHVIDGDAFSYHAGANLLVDGKGFIVPIHYLAGFTVEAADHPPLYFLYLAIPSLFGLDSALTHMVWSALLGTSTIVVTGFLGRRVAGDRVGLLAAGLAAIYPNVWVWDGALLSETIAIFFVTLTLLLVYRVWERPTIGRVAALGASCGAAALSRSELVLLLPALLLPIVLLARDVDWRERWRQLGVGLLVAIAVMTPWIAYNMTRFEHPVLLSSQLEPTLAGANCKDTYSGYAFAYITSTCLGGLDPTDDQSVNSKILRDRTERFVRDHLDRVPAVVAARVGRVLGVYRPGQQIDFDVFEGRERGLAMVASWSYYLVAALAIAGAIALRRRRAAPLFPLLVAPAIVVVTVATTYGTTRFRAAAETSLVVLAAVALDWCWSRRASRSADPASHSAGCSGPSIR